MEPLKEYWTEFRKGLNLKNRLPASDQRNEVETILTRIKELLMDAEIALSEGRKINRHISRLDPKVESLKKHL